MSLRHIPGATPTFDADGNERVDIVTCGNCGQSWNDAAVSSVTPVPAGRCPFEYEHEDEEPEPVWTTQTLQEEFEVLGFSAPFVVVKRRSDGVKGSLQFTHQPRIYFGWEPHR